MSNFDLKKALKGEPVVLRNGTKAYIRHCETRFAVSRPLIGYRLSRGTVVFIQWTECGLYSWSKGESEHDIVGMWVEPLVFEHWDLLHEDIKYLVKDDNERWYAHSGKPSKDEEERNAPRYDGCYSVAALNPTIFPDCDWENSLIERPEK